MVKLKHTIIKEIMFYCEYKLHNCYISESYTPMAHETLLDSVKQARKAGWCIRNNKTCCPRCKKLIKEGKNEKDI